jgi:hypothetical protein
MKLKKISSAADVEWQRYEYVNENERKSIAFVIDKGR